MKEVKIFPEVVDILNHIDFLLESGANLAYPHIKPIWKKVYELRFKTIGGQQRIFYFMHTGNKIVLLDGDTKKTQKIPLRILGRVKKYYLDYLKHGHEKPYDKK